MIITLASVLVLWWCGHVALQKIAGYSGSQIDVFISWGLSLSLSAATLIFWLLASPFPLNTSSWLLLAIGIFVLIRAAVRGDINIPIRRWIRSVDISLVEIGLLLLVIFHMAIVVLAHNSADIFPWDAFTTWMYRAKAWVLSNAAAPLTPTSEWLGNLTHNYPAEAAHYPVSVSAIAAFSSTLVGGWDSASASVPWLFVSVASAALMLGLCRQIGAENRLTPIMGMALLMTTPLLHIHGMLAGYADIWVQATSGMGLASLCIWSQKRTITSLMVSLALLCLGTFFKFEGWLWLGIGILSIFILSGRLKTLVVTVLFLVLVYCSISLVSSFFPTTLGAWGYTDSTLFFGPLGSIAFRPLNPVEFLVNETALRGNYLLLFPLYICCIGWSIICGKDIFFGYWLIGFLALGALLIIFSLTGFSIYTELGTALNRLILQILPILVLSITAIGNEFISSGSDSRQTANGKKPSSQTVPRSLLTATFAILTSMLMLPAVWQCTLEQRQNTSIAFEKKYPASEFTSVEGDFRRTESGYKFTDGSAVIGVAKINATPMGVQPRYVHLHAEVNRRDALSFYWINNLDPRVHSVPITVSGKTLLDMSQYADFWQLSISEMGYLASPAYFEDITVHSLSQSQSLHGSHSELINLWLTPGELGQQIINGIDGNSPSPINFNTVLILALVLLLLAAALEAALVETPKIFTRAHTISAIAGIWLTGSIVYLQQATAYAADLQLPIWNPTVEQDHPLPSLKQKAIGAIETAVSNFQSSLEIDGQSNATEDRAQIPVLIASEGRAESQYLAHKLPFALLPLVAAKIELSQLMDLPENTSALLVFFGAGDTAINSLMQNGRVVVKKINMGQITGDNFSLWRVQTQ